MKKINKILFLPLAIYATIIRIVDFDKKNLLLIFILPIFLFFVLSAKKINLRQLFKKEYRIVWFFLFYLLLSSAVNFDKLRLSSLMYSLDLCICFIMYIYLINSYIIPKDYSRWLIWIITSFFVVLLIQQGSILLGNKDFFNNLGYMSYQIEDNYLFSLNSLSTEPSYAVTIVSISFYSLLKMRTQTQRDISGHFWQDVLIWFMYIYQLVFYRSVFGVIFFVVIIYSVLDFKKIRVWLFLGVAVIILAGVSANYLAMSRLLNFIKNLDVHDVPGLASVDHSGAIRVLPFYYYIINFNFTNFHTYLGFGMDYAQTYLLGFIPGIPEGGAFGGLIPMFIFDYGLIGFWLLWKIISRFSLTQLFSAEVMMLCMVMVNATLNTQLFWFVLIVFAINKTIMSHQQVRIQPVRFKDSLS